MPLLELIESRVKIKNVYRPEMEHPVDSICYAGIGLFGIAYKG